MDGTGEQGWSSFLSDELGCDVEVRFGRARREVLVAKSRGRGLVVRMNHFFEAAPEDVRLATLQWLRSGKRARKACQRLDDWIAERVESLPPRAKKSLRLAARGEHHDLRAMLTGLLAEEFAQVTLDVPVIGWGRSGKPRRSLQLGSFDPETHSIRIHPVLDQAAVPAYFVRYVVFHELLHVELDEGKTASGRAIHHGPRFRARENAYVDYDRALEWQHANLTRLMRSARSKRPLAVPKERKGFWRIRQGWLFGG